MRRRQFLQLGAVMGGGATALSWLDPSGAPDVREEQFHVAGVRYHKFSGQVHSGEELRIRGGRFKGRTCYEVLLRDGQKIGYVPRRHLPKLQGRDVVRAFASQVDPHALPWKRYCITLVTRPARKNA